MGMIVDVPEIKIMYVIADGGVKGSRGAFAKLESCLPTLKGRKFYGLIFGIPPHDTYWAAVASLDTDNPTEKFLKIGVIPGGNYAQERIKNWNENILTIDQAFQRLSRQNTIDSSRPSVEFYRSMKDMLVRLPIL